ncbi:MAG: hypothetical protein WAL37_09570 [Xanthobacteraceae bacterium]
MQTSGKNRWEWVFPLAWFILAVVTVAAITIWRINGTQAAETAISQTGPPASPDGSAAHPYPDASQCPANNDLVFWPSGGLAPSFPASISVCFVESQNSGPDRVEVRDR